jgi:hypothetical protein
MDSYSYELFVYSSCPDGETCCQLESGEYGCCPLRMFSILFIYLFEFFRLLADAVCCSKKIKYFEI